MKFTPEWLAFVRYRSLMVLDEIASIQCRRMYSSFSSHVSGPIWYRSYAGPQSLRRSGMTVAATIGIGVAAGAGVVAAGTRKRECQREREREKPAWRWKLRRCLLARPP